VFVQPTENNIETDSINYLKSNNIVFIKTPLLSNKQTNNSVNYTNKVATLAYLRDYLTSPYICWLDTDVVFLNKTSNLFADTSQIVVSAFTAGSLTVELDIAHLFDIKESIAVLYNCFKEYLNPIYQLDSLTHYVNSWFVYGLRDIDFWVEWKDLTYNLLDILQQNYPELVNKGFECFCEELALSILYNKDPSMFISVSKHFNSNVLSMIHTDTPEFMLTANSVLFHYTGVLDNECSAITGNDYKKDVYSILSSLLSRKKISNSTFIKLTKNI
jgi:hypothetical protein